MKPRIELHEAITRVKKARKRQKKELKERINEYIRVADGLEVIQEWLVSLRIDDSSHLDISVAGDHNVMKGLYSALRKLGYDTTDRPEEEKIPGYSNWWRHKDHHVQLWVAFTSTKCTRKKVGTKMVEQPVYEIVCE